MKRFLSLILALILFVFSLVACAREDEPTLEDPVVEDEILIGNEIENTVTVYFFELGSIGMIIDTQEFVRNIDVPLSYVVAQHLFSDNIPKKASHLFIGQGKFEDLYVSNGVAFLHISVPENYINKLSIFSAMMSITNTLCGLQDIDCVSLIINGEEFTPQGVLTNPMYPTDDDIGTLWLLHEKYYGSDAGIIPDITNDYILYFSDLSSNSLVAEVREAAFDTENDLKNVLDELVRGPNDTYLQKLLINDFQIENQIGRASCRERV